MTRRPQPGHLSHGPSIGGCACVHDDRYECMRLRSGPREFDDDDDMPRECCECGCHDDYEAVCNDEGRDE